MAIEKQLEHLVQDFITDTECTKVHVTHTDMDGVGCSVIRRLVTPVDFEFYEDKISQLNDHLMKYAEFLHNRGLVKNGTLRFLITDLGSVDPLIFVRIGHSTGLNVIAIVVDHHKHSKDDLTEIDIMNHQLDSKGQSKSGAYFLYGTDPMESSTMQVYHLFNQFINARGSYTHNAILEFAQNVSLYDTGHWGEWDKEYYSNVSPTVKMQLAFSELMTHYTKIDGAKTVMGIPAECFSDIGYDVRSNTAFTTVSTVIAWNLAAYATQIYAMPAFEPKDPLDLYSGAAMGERNFTQLKAANDKFFANIVSLDEADNTLWLNQDWRKLLARQAETLYAANTKVYMKLTPEDALPYFSLISREYFDTTTDTDVLIMWDEVYDTCGLRSNGKVDVAEIARALGGGGHVRASGFPLTNSDET